MSYCPKCGSKVRAEMSFCPKCGASLKAEQAPAPTVPPVPYRAEKAEKSEKGEKEERPEKVEGERYEIQRFAWIGPLIGGLILIFAGLTFYVAVTASFRWEVIGALSFIIIGIVIIVGAVYAAMVATRRHPQA